MNPIRCFLIYDIEFSILNTINSTNNNKTWTHQDFSRAAPAPRSISFSLSDTSSSDVFSLRPLLSPPPPSFHSLKLNRRPTDRVSSRVFPSPRAQVFRPAVPFPSIPVEVKVVEVKVEVAVTSRGRAVVEKPWLQQSEPWKGLSDSESELEMLWIAFIELIFVRAQNGDSDQEKAVSGNSATTSETQI